MGVTGGGRSVLHWENGAKQTLEENGNSSVCNHIEHWDK